jgi:hypothetical protein
MRGSKFDMHRERSAVAAQSLRSDAKLVDRRRELFFEGRALGILAMGAQLSRRSALGERDGKVGGQVFPPAKTAQSITKVLIASIPSAGTAILRNELFSEPLPFGTISSDTWSGSAEKSI